MKKYDPAELKQIIEAADFEQRSREFKQPLCWSDKKSVWLRESVIRSVFGMANIPAGGTLIVGISEDANKNPIFQGVTEDELKSFEPYEAIKGTIDGFSTAPISLVIGWGEYEPPGSTKVTLVILTIAEFDSLPAICRKDGETDKLRKGDLYSRAKKGHAATIRVTEAEFAEIIRMATDKEVADLYRRGYLREVPTVSSLKDQDEAQFASQIEEWEKI